MGGSNYCNKSTQRGRDTTLQQHEMCVLLTCSDSSSFLLYSELYCERKDFEFNQTFEMGRTYRRSSIFPKQHQKADHSGSLWGEHASWFHQRAETETRFTAVQTTGKWKKKKNQNNNCFPHMLCFQRPCAMTEKAEPCLWWQNMRETVRGDTEKRTFTGKVCGVHPPHSARVSQKAWPLLKQEVPAWSCTLIPPPHPTPPHLSQQRRQDLEDVLWARTINLTWNHNHKSN